MKVKEFIGKQVDKGVKFGTKVKEYLVDDTLDDVDKILTMKKENKGDDLNDI